MKVRITTHSGEEKIVDVDSFGIVEATDITEKRNDSTIESIQIGVVSFSRIDIKTVEPYIEEEITTSDRDI